MHTFFRLWGLRSISLHGWRVRSLMIEGTAEQEAYQSTVEQFHLDNVVDVLGHLVARVL